jgi:hypothetical protein
MDTANIVPSRQKGGLGFESPIRDSAVGFFALFCSLCLPLCLDGYGAGTGMALWREAMMIIAAVAVNVIMLSEFLSAVPYPRIGRPSLLWVPAMYFLGSSVLMSPLFGFVLGGLVSCSGLYSSQSVARAAVIVMDSGIRAAFIVMLPLVFVACGPAVFRARRLRLSATTASACRRLRAGCVVCLLLGSEVALAWPLMRPVRDGTGLIMSYASVAHDPVNGHLRREWSCGCGHLRLMIWEEFDTDGDGRLDCAEEPDEGTPRVFRLRHGWWHEEDPRTMCVGPGWTPYGDMEYPPTSAFVKTIASLNGVDIERL